VPLTAGEVVRDFVGNATLRGLYGVLVPLLEAYLVLPASSAECERGISVLKLIKTARRNYLSQATLEQLMMIKLNGLPSEEHDFDVAAALFFSKKHWRLTVGMEYTARVKSEYKWGYVCGKEHIEGEEEERAFDEEDARSRILTGSAPADASQANSDKAAEKVNKLNAEA
jgi:hypothetical protein